MRQPGLKPSRVAIRNLTPAGAGAEISPGRPVAPRQSSSVETFTGSTWPSAADAVAGGAELPLDQPEEIAFKTTRLSSVGAAPTTELRTVAIDLRQDWPKALREAGLDTGHPCLSAPGTVTVVVVPFLPAARPEPNAGLLRTVRRHLAARRTLRTRLLVVGPPYVEVTATLGVRPLAGRAAERAGAALARISQPEPFDVQAANARFDAAFEGRWAA